MHKKSPLNSSNAPVDRLVMRLLCDQGWVPSYRSLERRLRDLVDPEVHLDIHFHRNIPALENCWLEFVRPHRFQRLFVEPHPQRPHDVHALRIPCASTTSPTTQTPWYL